MAIKDIDLHHFMDKSILMALRSRLRQQARDLSDLPEGVWKRAGALNTWGTNAIEGNTLTHGQVEALLLEQTVPGGLPLPDVAETLQHAAAFRGLLARRARPLDLVAALELHEEVFRGFPGKRPGQWRTSNVYIAGTAYRPPRRDDVVPAMEAWRQRVSGLGRRRAEPFAEAAWMHHRFEQIHPFEDGNGRAGRLLMNLFFLQCGWPPVHILPPDRWAYLDALEAGNAGDLLPLEHLLRVAMARGLLDLLDQVGDAHDALADLGVVRRHIGVRNKADYLALRCRQGVIPAIRAGETSGRVAGHGGRPRWLTSVAGLRLWAESR